MIRTDNFILCIFYHDFIHFSHLGINLRENFNLHKQCWGALYFALVLKISMGRKIGKVHSRERFGFEKAKKAQISK
jgi:hypothetical protein